MTKTEKIRKAIERHTTELKKLSAEYRRRFDNVSVNEFGEVNGDELIRINEWHDREQARINKEFADALR